MPGWTEALATGANKDELVVIYIPSADRDGASLGKEVQIHWVRESLRALGKTLGGGTAFPRGLGVWRDDERGGNLVWDKPVIVQCYTTSTDLDAAGEEIIKFAKRMGRETNQGAVALIAKGRFIVFPAPFE
jgi:hypothetical protein